MTNADGDGQLVGRDQPAAQPGRGEISAIYIGESIEAMPMPVPPTIRATTRCHGARGMADPTEQSTNSTAASNITFFRPKRSAQDAGDGGPTGSRPAPN